MALSKMRAHVLDVQWRQMIISQSLLGLTKVLRRLLLPVVGSILIVTLAMIYGAYTLWTEVPDSAVDVRSKVISIPYGTTRAGVYHLIEDGELISQPNVFRFLDQIFHYEASFLAGDYEIMQPISMEKLADVLRSNDVVQYDLIIPEGLTVRQVINKLEAIPILSGKIKEIPKEGSLFPAIYHYEKGHQRSDLIAHMQRRMRQELHKLWPLRDRDARIKTQEEWVTLASIVERETGVSEERGLIAGVFLNRLRKGYRLQADPTVIYQVSAGLGVLDRKLRTSDLRKPGPYNTYRNYGLPPGPIANPGSASLRAVIQPEVTDYLYFVADGHGGHRFAKTLKEHNKNVRALRELRKNRKSSP